MAVILICAILAPFLGCLGSTVSKDDLHRNARRRHCIHSGINLLSENIFDLSPTCV